MRTLDPWKPRAASSWGLYSSPYGLAGIWGPYSSYCGVWVVASYLWSEVLGHNFLPFFPQFFIWSNFIFCLKQKKEKKSNRSAPGLLLVTQASWPLERTPWKSSDHPSPTEQEAEAQTGEKTWPRSPNVQGQPIPHHPRARAR